MSKTTTARTMMTKAFNTNFANLSAKQTSPTKQLLNNKYSGKSLDCSTVTKIRTIVAQTKINNKLF